MIRKVSSILVLALIFFSCGSKKKISIVGKWKEYKVETIGGSDTTTIGIKLTPFQELEFTNDYFITFRKEKVIYKIKNDTIFFRNEPWYLIEKLNSDTLVILEIYFPGSSPNSQRSFYYRQY